ncbi:MAG: choice-of-anchor B family protein [Saprospiraceae bacterium]|nr:choice-of-anchor B family protein [Saprospiraceae bacterium]
MSHISFGQNSSDVWGYKKDNINYAIIGNATKTSIFSLEDPSLPILRYEANGAQSVWRDIKSYKDHLYVTTDQGSDGLVIIDMTNAPEIISHTNFKPLISLGTEVTELQRCHNLYIDEKGFVYLAGCNIGKRGVLIFDLNIDPLIPEFKGAADLTYSHDAFTRGDTLYASEINIGKLSIYDVTNKALPVLIGTQSTSRSFTHNAWPSDDGKFVFTTDEKKGGYIDAYDITDLPNFKLLDKFRPLERENDGVIPHNTHYYDGYLVTSWYTDGVRIVDAHKPDNLIEVAYYDTWEDPSACHTGFFGCWGAFPFTGSNLIYASDINNGLFVIEVDYKRACYVEGIVKDTDGLAIPNAKIHILSNHLNSEISSPAGEFKTGLAYDGNFIVEVSHPDFVTQNIAVELIRGEVTYINPVLLRKRTFDVHFELLSTDDEPIKADILLSNPSFSYEMQTDDTGILNQQLFSSDYELFVNSWGYENIYMPHFVIGEGAENAFSARISRAYADNFETQLGWQVNSTQGMSGGWVRSIPKQTEYLTKIANPGVDSDDPGNFAYVTGNGIRGAGCDDVDNGISVLVSPPMDLSEFSSPKLNYDVWFFNAGGSTPVNDTLVVKLTNGQTEVIVDKIFATTQVWKKVRNIDVESFISTTDSLRLLVEVSDVNQGHLVEAGFDNFFVTETISSIKEDVHTSNTVHVYPNPADNQIIVELEDKKFIKPLKFRILNILGVIVSYGTFDFHTVHINTTPLTSGLYLLDIEGRSPVKFIKQ